MDKYIRITGIALIITGFLAILVAYFADMLRLSGQSGFGSKQLILVGLGLGAILLGFTLHTRPTRLYITQWFNPGDMEKSAIEISNWKDVFIIFMLFGLWFGLVTGFIEVIYRSFEKFILSDSIGMSYHFVWMTPLTFILIFLILTLIMIFLRLILGPRFTFQLMLGLNILLLLICLYYNKPRIHMVAYIVLAIGLAYQLSRVLIKRQTLFKNMVFNTLPWMVITILAITVFMLGYLG